MDKTEEQLQKEIKTEDMLETPVVNLSLLLKSLTLRNKDKEEK